MIRRAARPTQDFTVLRNDVLRDSRLSYRARGILGAILSRPDNWSIRADQLAREGGEGRDAIRTALNELRQYGYLHTVTYQDDGGRFHTDQVVYDNPQFSLGIPENPQPKPGNPTSVNQASENQALLEELSRRTVKKDSPSIDVHQEGFDAFWMIFPRKIGKGTARSAFIKALKKTDLETLLSGAEKYAAAREGQDKNYTAHPATWLNGERWSDEDPPTSPSKPGTMRDREIDFVKEAMNRIKEAPHELR